VFACCEAIEGIARNGQPPIAHALDGNLVGRILSVPEGKVTQFPQFTKGSDHREFTRKVHKGIALDHFQLGRVRQVYRGTGRPLIDEGTEGNPPYMH
jgi:hypothetical protein